MPDPVITQQDINDMQQLWQDGNRTAVYLKYFELTGSEQALMEANIATFSNTYGAIANNANDFVDALDAVVGATAGQFFDVGNNYSVTVEEFSIEITSGLLTDMQNKLDSTGSGYLTDIEMVQSAENVWESKGLGSSFPGDPILALDHLVNLEIGDALSDSVLSAGAYASLASVIWNYTGSALWRAASLEPKNAEPIKPADFALSWEMGDRYQIKELEAHGKEVFYLIDNEQGGKTIHMFDQNDWGFEGFLAGKAWVEISSDQFPAGSYVVLPYNVGGSGTWSVVQKIVNPENGHVSLKEIKGSINTLGIDEADLPQNGYYIYDGEKATLRYYKESNAESNQNGPVNKEVKTALGVLGKTIEAAGLGNIDNIDVEYVSSVIEEYIFEPIQTFLDYTGISDLASIIDIPGNEWISDSLVTTGSILLGPANVVFSSIYHTGSAIYNVFSGNQITFDNQIDAVTTPSNNLYMDIWTDFNQSISDFTTDNALIDNTTGFFMDGGNYFGSMLSGILNGDGWSNVAPSGISANDFRPGNVENGSSDGFLSIIETTLDNIGSGLSSLVEGITDTLSDWGSSLVSGISSLTGAKAAAPNLINIDPLVLDMDGDGVELLSFQNSFAVFDVDNDGYIENTGWVNADDAILVHDVNDDGIINDITETISEYYLAAPGTGAIYQDGLQALATLDSNSDGVFDANDTAWNTLRVWQDSNEDAVTDNGELKTLDELNITSIDLTREIVNREEIEGNPVLSRSTMTINGIEHMVASVDFATNALGYEWNDILEGVRITTEDGSEATLALESTAGETVDLTALNNDGDANNDVSSVVGNIGDDTITGDDQDNWLVGGAGSDTLHGGAGNDMLVIDADDDVTNIDAGEGFDIVQASGERSVVLNLNDVNAEVAIGGDASDILMGGGNTNVFIRGGAGNDVIIGGSADDALSGEEGDDTIDGGHGDDILRGHRGEDRLIGDLGEDVLEGGEGNDTLYGGVGEDLLKGGAGNDELFGGDDYDVAEFRGKLDEYDVTILTNGRVQVTDRVEGRDGTDILTDIEALNFHNIKEVELDLQNPFTADDIVDVSGNGPHIISASAILANDLDYQGDSLSITGVSSSIGGTATLLGDGNVEFIPDPYFKGVMSFKYTIQDSHGNAGAQAVLMATGDTAELKGTVNLRTTEHPDDQLFYDQWYLSDANIIPTWEDYTGNGVNVGVLELGLIDADHSDLVDNITQETIDSVGDDPGDGHATLVAGVIGALNNGVGSIGVAYDATISGLTLGGENADNINVIFDYKQYDVVNNSWGFTEPFVDSAIYQGSGHAAFEDAASQGRNGLGTILVFAAGNDRQTGDNSDAYNFNNSKYTISVGAINKNADLASLEIQQDPFSNPGSNILVSGPGSNITSTSVLLENSNGSTFGDSHETTQGTSFATPIVSGITALMLEANKDLGYRDVQEILAYTARQVNDVNSNWQTNAADNWNGGGLHFSHDYGFGNVDALAAVRLAETWNKQQIYTDEATYTVNGNWSNQAITDNGTISDTITIPSGIDLEIVEHAHLTLDFTHTRVGDLIIKLVSPNGFEATLLERLGVDPGSSTDTGHGTETLEFEFGSVGTWGEQASGDWTLIIEDSETGEIGTINSWSLELSGKTANENDTYIYTEEFSSLTNVSRFTLDDAAGDDTINAAAILHDTILDLNAGSNSTIDGHTVTLSAGTTIERAITGDGNDTLTGNSTNNLLFGGRGNDTLSGGDGDDWLVGAQGDDIAFGGSGRDRYIIRAGDEGSLTIQNFDTANDVIMLAGYSGIYQTLSDLTLSTVGNDTVILLPDGQEIIIENLLPTDLNDAHLLFSAPFSVTDAALFVNEYWGTENADTHNESGSSNPSVMYGKGGDDTLTGGSGNDIIYGGVGNDTINGGGGDDIIYGGIADGENGSGDQTWNILSGGSGNDTIHMEDGLNKAYGGSGQDTFVIHQDLSDNGGILVQQSGISVYFDDIIYDFDPQNDVIDLTAFKQINSLDDISPSNWYLNGFQYGVVRIDDQTGQKVTLVDVNHNDLTDANFIFYENHLPEAIADTLTTSEDTPLLFSVTDLLANDSDIEDGAPTFSKIVTSPQNGTLTDDGEGNYTYTPDDNFFGEDRFTYEVVDAHGDSTTSVVSINIASVNDNPIAQDEVFSINRNETLSGNVLTGTNQDTDVDGDFLTAQPETALITTNGGSVTINSDGTFDYTPAPAYIGDDSFNYTVLDGKGGSDTGTVNITVLNILPQAVNDTLLVTEDHSITYNVLANDSDTDGSIVGVESITQGTNGVVVDNGDGTLTYTPNSNFNGTDSFSYTIVDNDGGQHSASVDVTVSAENDAPVATDDSATTEENSSVVISLLTNDTDIDGDTLSILSTSQGTNGTVVDNGDGTVTYTPNASFNGTDSFSYTVSDGNGGEHTANVTVNVTELNDNPVATNDNFSGDEDTAITGNVLTNDSDVDGHALNIVAGVLATAQGGSVNILANGDFTYTPAANFNGTDTFDYTVEDGFGGSDTGTVTLTVNSVNDAPVATDDTATTDEDTAVTIDLLANDSDADGDVLSILSTSQGTNGTVVDNGDGSATYTPNDDFHGTDSFSYTVIDGNGGEHTATVTVNVSAVNDAPVVTNNGATLDEDTILTLSTSMLNVQDIDNIANDLIFTILSIPTNSDLMLNGIEMNPNDTFTLQDIQDGSVTFQPDLDQNGSFGFDFTVSDGEHISTSTMFVMNVNPINDDPIANADTAGTIEETSINIDVLANDVDVDQDILDLIISTNAANGVVSINPDKTVSYTPNAGFIGQDSFTYEVSDGNGGTSSASVTINVDPAVFVPLNATQDSFIMTSFSAGVTGNVLENDEGTGLDVTSGYYQTHAGGMVYIADNGDINYMPYGPGYTQVGSDYFYYSVADSQNNTDTVYVGITGGVDDTTPSIWAAPDYIYTEASATQVTGNVLYNDSGTDLSVVAGTYVTHEGYGTVTISENGSFTYTPGEDFVDYDFFAYIVEDASGARTWTWSQISTDINYYDEPRAASDDFYMDNPENGLTGNLLTNDRGYNLTAVAGTFTTEEGGTVVIQENGDFVYTPPTHFNGWDDFDYDIVDPLGGDDDGRVYITGPEPLNARSDYFDLFDLEADFTGNVLQNDAGEGLVVTAETVTTSAGGTITFQSNGDFVYTPPADFDEYDDVQYTVTDANGNTDTAWVDFEDATEQGQYINGTSSADILTGTEYDDYIYAGGGSDTIYGEGGSDTIYADSGNDTVYGGAGNDNIRGNGGHDEIHGGSGNDEIRGGGKDDVLYGEDGLDQLWGNNGADTFVFESTSAFNDVDIIKDLDLAEGDALDIADLLTAYDPLSDAITDFVQITDNGSNSTLSIDVDGGADNFVTIATMQNITGLTDEDALESSGNLITV